MPHRRRLLLVALAPAVLLGCQRLQARRDTAAPRPPATLPSPLARDGRPPADAPAAPPGSEVVPAAARSAAPADDGRKPLRERIEERRDERKDRRDPPKPPADTSAPAAVAPAKANDLDAVRKLYAVAAERYAKLVDLEARLVRREVVGGLQGPTEEVLFQYRKQPLSVYMKSVVPPTGANGKPNVAREVLYVKGQHDGKMHVKIGTAEANFIMPAGSVQAFDPDSKLVTSRSRKRIYEAGFGDSLAKFGRLIEATASGRRPGGVRSLGPVKRDEYPYPLDGIEAQLQPGDDPLLPKGGRKLAFFDMKPESPGYGVPVIVVTHDADNREVEYYCFDRIRMPANLSDDDFHPKRLGKP
jgi:hypothetical protein